MSIFESTTISTRDICQEQFQVVTQCQSVSKSLFRYSVNQVIQVIQVTHVIHAIHLMHIIVIQIAHVMQVIQPMLIIYETQVMQVRDAIG